MAANLPTDYQSYIHKSRYARFLPEEGRREHWDETVDRYFDFFQQDLDERHGYKPGALLVSELKDAVLNLSVMPSMRSLMTAGEALRRDNIAGYNCSFLPIDRPRAFAEALYILMCGTGVGFSCERQEISNLPIVPSSFERTAFDIVVGDSKMGWAIAFETLIACLYAGTIPHIDYSEVRPAGSPLKVFGGRASGPEPLRDLFEFTIRMFRNAAGRKLNSLEVHEIVCKTGEIVVVGGVRRSALISLSNLSDHRMRDCKSGQWWLEKPYLALANNSVAYTEKPEVGQFMEEWTALYKSRSGERGIFNREGAISKMLRIGRRDHRHNFGTNPCVTGDTMLLTKHGYAPIKSLVGVETEIWNGLQWSKVTPFSTGVNPLVQVTLSDGTSLTCTPYHKFVVQDGYKSQPYKVDARHLMLGQKLAKFDMPVVSAGKGDDHGAIPLQSSLEQRISWFSQLMDNAGSVFSGGNDTLQLVSDDREFLTGVRLLLTTLGVQANVALMKRAKGVATSYAVEERALYALSIDQADTYHLLSNVGVVFERLNVRCAPPQRDARRFVTVVSVVDLQREEETFCVTEPLNGTATFNGIVTGNCGEIVLRPRGLCNLSEAVVRQSDGVGDLKEKIRLAAIIGTWQSTLTTFGFVEPEWSANAEDERLLGVSLTGIYDNALMRGDKGLDTLAVKLEAFKAAAIKANRLEANEIGITPSVAITTVKPSGTVSQLVNSPSGIHQGHSEYYIRRVTGDNKDPITAFMVDAGIPHEPNAAKPQEMTVFSFPVKLGRGTTTRDSVSAAQHLELVNAYNTHWSEHAVSCTISVREHEWPSVGGWVYDHFDELAGLSFLPHFEGDNSYSQLPYETISREEYEAMLASMPTDINWEDLRFYERGIDTVTATREFACVGNTCEIVDMVSAV